MFKQSRQQAKNKKRVDCNRSTRFLFFCYIFIMQSLTNLKTYMNEATVTAKLAGYPLLLWIFSYTGISAEVSGILAVLLALDVLTALIRVGINDPTKLSSRIGIVGILSKCLTFSIPFIISIVGKASGYNMGAFTEYALKILVIYEGYSVIGNIGQIRAKDTTLNEYDAISFLISRITKGFKAILDFAYNSGTSDKPDVPEMNVPIEAPQEAPAQTQTPPDSSNQPLG